MARRTFSDGNSRIVWEDNSREAKDAMAEVSGEAVQAALLVIQAQAKAYTPVQSGALRDSIATRVADSSTKVLGVVGSPLEYAVYVEFGTGEFAEKGGRKGGWVYQDPSGEWFFTWGMEPAKFLRKAFRTKRGDVERIIGQKFKARFGG